MKYLVKRYYGSYAAPYVFLTPTLVLFIFVFVFPVSFVLYTSVFHWNLLDVQRGMRFVGLLNFKNLLTDIEFWESLLVTAKFVLMAVPSTVLFGLLLALLLNRNYRGKRFIQSIMLTPMMVSPVAAFLSFKFLLEPTYGIVNYLLKKINITGIGWFSSVDTALISVAIVDLWIYTPFVFIVLYAALQAVPQEPYEAAKIDGASALQLFRYVTFPSIKPVFIVVTIVRMMDSVRVFDSIFALTRGGPANATMTINYLCYHTSFFTLMVGKGSAIAIFIVVIILILGSSLIIQFNKSNE